MNTTGGGVTRGPALWRRRSAVALPLMVLALIAGLVVVAVSADGREISRTTANDGGAWVVSRELGAVGHKNWATGEITAFVQFEGRDAMDVLQTHDQVIVHDPVANELLRIDPRSGGADAEAIQIPEFSTVSTADDIVVITRAAPFAVWRYDVDGLRAVGDVGTAIPLVESEGSGYSAVRSDGSIAVVDDTLGVLRWVDGQGAVSEPISLFGSGLQAEAVLDVTIVDGSAVVLFANGDLAVVGQDALEHVVRWSQVGGSVPPLALLQQPTVVNPASALDAARSFVGVGLGGELVRVSLDDGVGVRVLGSLDSRQPLRPIVHNGCVFGVAVAVSPPVYGTVCEGSTSFTSNSLAGLGQDVRLRLVNGWVWITDVESGATFAIDDTLKLEALNDWSAVEAQSIQDDDPLDDSSADDEPSPDALVIDDPDAAGDIADADQFDPSEANVPPVAEDDALRTRVDQAVLIDVLDNDFDANNDILVVDDVELLSGEGRVGITPDGTSVQVTPGAGYVGTMTVRYTISDGRSEPVAALVTVTVVADEQANLAPVTETDVVAIEPGAATTIDVLQNDTDPDGDALALTSVEATTGTVRWDPTGQITYTPDTTTEEGWIELTYVVNDGEGAESEGLVRVEIRDIGANQEPDARNDQATTVAGRAVALNLLANDSDPDGDPLFVGGPPRLLDPEEANIRTSHTPDGEFVFEAAEPGVYVFSYTVNDAAQGGSESDTARIRIDVLPAETNDPPVAVRDDAVLPVGETRTVYVLDNDGDPDGDIVSIVDWQASGDLLVTEYDDGSGVVGFQLVVPPGATADPLFQYWISDGVNEPVSAPIVINVVDRTVQDQPPIATNDLIEARAGTTIESIDVLANDFDPEGGALQIVAATSAADVSLTVRADGQSIDLQIPDDTTASFTVAYDIVDLAGNRAAAVLRVQLVPPGAANRPPVARTDEVRTAHGQAIIIDVLANDSDPDNDAISLEGVTSQPANGTASQAESGRLRYVPDVGFAGTDVLRYAIVDAAGDRAVGEVFIGVAEAADLNLPPIANDDSFGLVGSAAITPLDVLANDFDPEGDPLVVIAASDASLGSVRVDEFGRVLYEPPADVLEAVVATFGYVIQDTAGNQARAVVSIDLAGVVEPTPNPADPTPTPTPTSVARTEPNQSEPPATPEPTTTTVPTPTPTPTPTSTLVPTSTPTPTPTATPGPSPTPDDATATPTPEPTATTEATSTPTPTPTEIPEENQAPEVQTLTTTTAFETSLSLDLSGQASDPDGDDLFFICCDSIRGGTLTNVATAANIFTLTFTPDDGFSGSAGFAFTVDDQRGEQRSGSVSIQVESEENQAPVTTGDTVQIPQGEQATIDLTRLSGDPEGEPVTRTLISEPGGGVAVSVSGDSAVVTVERDTAVGSAGSFTYEISDGVFTATGDVAIEVVAGANTAPTASDTAVSLAANSSTSVGLAALASETDPGDSLTFTLAGASTDPLTVSLVDSVLQISAPVDSTDAEVAIDFIATDTRGAEATGTVAVTVTAPTAPLPSAADDAATVERNGLVTSNVLVNDVDPLGGGLTIVSAEAPWGSAFVSGDQVGFSPGDQVGLAVITYTVRDSANRTASAVLRVDTVGVPDAPAPPSVTAESGQATITWAAPDLNGSPLVSYIITSSTGETFEVFDSNTHTWTGLENGDPYTFTVIATNEIGPSLPSGPSVEVIPNQKPETPAPPVVAFDDEQLGVTWSPPTNEGSPIIGYEVEIGPDSAVLPFGQNITMFDWPDLTNGEEYTFRVRAENAAGWSDFSQPSTPEHPLRAPDPPQIGSAQRTGLSSSLTVDWTWSADWNNGDPVSAFEVQISNDPTPRRVNDSTARSFEWTGGLTDGEQVQFQVRALNRGDWGDWSSWSNLIQSCSAPDAVANVQAVRDNEQVALTWDEPDDNGCGITNYVITSNAGAIQNSATTSHPFTGLSNGTTYDFTVVATNEIGTSVVGPNSSSNQVTPAGPPLCGVNAILQASVSAPNAVNLTWPNLFTNNGDVIIDYLIDSGAGFQSVGASAESTTITGLADGTLYNFAVRAENTVDESVTCGTTTATTWGPPTAVALALSFDGDTDTLTVAATGGRTLDGATGPAYTITINAGAGNASNTAVDFTGEPDGQSHDFPILEDPNFNGNDGAVAATIWVCNDAHCVTKAEVITSVQLIDPPDQMTAADISFSSVDMAVLSGGLIGTQVWTTFDEPAANGGTILSYEWQSTGPINGSGFGDQTADPSSNLTWLNYDSYPGYSNNVNGENNGAQQTWQLRVRAVNEAGPGLWSAWQSHLVPVPPATFEADRAGNCGATCRRVRVSVYGLSHNTAYTVRAAGNNVFCGTLVTDAGGSANNWVGDCQPTSATNFIVEILNLWDMAT